MQSTDLQWHCGLSQFKDVLQQALASAFTNQTVQKNLCKSIPYPDQKPRTTPLTHLKNNPYKNSV